LATSSGAGCPAHAGREALIEPQRVRVYGGSVSGITMMVDGKRSAYILSEARGKLGIKRGTRLWLSVKDTRIILIAEGRRLRLVRAAAGGAARPLPASRRA